MKHPAEKAVYHRALTLIVQEAHRRLDEMEAQNLVSLGYAIVVSNFEAPDFLFRALPEHLAKVCVSILVFCESDFLNVKSQVKV